MFRRSFEIVGLGEHFRLTAADHGFALDAAQSRAVSALEGKRGVYLWGPVGRGKTWLMDAFFAGVHEKRKQRWHFHDFFRSYYAGGLALDGLRLVCFDEFHFHDPGDAMIVARLMRELFERRIRLVTTSNYPPSGLLPNPLHHHLFEPTIELITARMDVVELAGPVDYRSLDATEHWGVYSWPACEPSDGVHFTFDFLCRGPRSVQDYLGWAAEGRSWVVTGVPALAAVSPDARQRFLNLVDVLYDKGIHLVLNGQLPLDAVLADVNLPDFARTASRLRLLKQVWRNHDTVPTSSS
ncbi:cell division protein ZapE [Lentzea tibetensis]|uniref:Cell division protein ZapE n=1 Tax=Lentzea tibetensis TaxID=2591470 RepID=A0A563EQN3_9PSEU|nr:cell division protein ZapE [Lentzea tibetensis]